MVNGTAAMTIVSPTAVSPIPNVYPGKTQTNHVHVERLVLWGGGWNGHSRSPYKKNSLAFIELGCVQYFRVGTLELP